MSGGLARYRRVLAAPHVAALYAASLVARLPIGINGLAIILFMRERTGSFAAAGAAAGAFVLLTALSSPVQGRLIDRRGPRRILPRLVALQAAGVLAFVVAGVNGAPTAVLVVLAGTAGLGMPPWSSVMRAMWPRLLGDDGLVTTAFALDAALVEVVFVLGPLLTAAATAVFSPQLALVISAGMVVAGTVPFVGSAPIRSWVVETHADRNPLGALRSPGLRTVVLATIPIGFCLGSLEVALPAFAAAHGSPHASGVLIAVWSAGSAIGGVAYGARAWTRPLSERWILLTAALAVSLLPLLAAPSVLAMVPLLLPAGAFVAPAIASGSQLMGSVAPAGMGTEAYAWGPTALVTGAGLGSAVAGILAEAQGWRTAAATAVVVGAAGAAVATARRHTLVA